MRRPARSASVPSLALASILLAACGSSPPAPATPSPQRTAATATPSSSPAGQVDAHQLGFQQSDIPPGFAPHPGAILTIDANTVVSEKLLKDGSALAANGFESGAEYGWERPSDHKMAAESVVMVFASTDGAQTMFQAVADTIKTYMAEDANSAMFADSEHGFHQGDLDLALVREGRIVFLVQTSSASPQNDVDLAMMLDQRLRKDR